MALKGAVACRGKASRPLRGTGIRASVADKARWRSCCEKGLGAGITLYCCNAEAGRKEK